MQAQRLTATAVSGWYRRGWTGFRAQPGPWIGLTVALAVVCLVGLLLPLGQLLLVLAAPALGAGLLHAAREAERDRAVTIGHLAAGLTDAASRGPLLLLGGLLVLVTAVLLGLFLTAAQTLGVDPGRPATVGPLPVAGLVGLALLAAAAAAAMAAFFAVPLVHFGRAGLGSALRASFLACLAHLRPLLAYGLSFGLLGLLASLPYGLGWLVLGPVGAGAWLACFEAVFPVGDRSPN